MVTGAWPRSTPSTVMSAPGGSVLNVTSRVSASGAASTGTAATAASTTAGGGGGGSTAFSLRCLTTSLPPNSATTVVTTAAMTTATSATQIAILSGLFERSTGLRRGPVILARSVDRVGSSISALTSLSSSSALA